MKIKKSKAIAKKPAMKTGKVQNAKNIVKKTEAYPEKRMLKDAIAMAENMGIDVENLIKTELIRAIQRAEGHCDCYMSGEVLICGQINCLWREGCEPLEVVSIISSD